MVIAEVDFDLHICLKSKSTLAEGSSSAVAKLCQDKTVNGLITH